MRPEQIQRCKELVVLAATAVLSVTTMTAQADNLNDLPLYDQDAVAYDGDWLVHAPDREAAVYRTGHSDELVLANGIISRTFRLAPNAATVGFDNLTTGQAILRGVKPEAMVEIDGVSYDVGGLKGQPNYAFLSPEWLDDLEADPAAFAFTGFEVGEPRERMAWKQVRHRAPDAVWPPKGVYLRMDYRMPEGVPGSQKAAAPPVTLSVHYELYDGVPVMSKWITLRNDGGAPIMLNRFTTEILAAVEYSAHVESGGRPFQTPNMHVETDYAFNGMDSRDSCRFSVHWVRDPDYATQVNYLRLSPCLLEVRPELGPGQALAPGETFESFHAFLLPFDSYDRERNALAQNRMYRTVAP